MLQFFLMIFFCMVTLQDSSAQPKQEIKKNKVGENKSLKSDPVADTVQSKFNPALIKEGTSKFQINVELRDKQFQISSTQTILKTTVNAKNIIRIVEFSTGTIGNTTDTTDYDAKTLFPISQRTQQGGAAFNFTFTNKSITGSMLADSQIVPINAELTEPTLPNSSSVGAILATLPYTEGYSTSISMFDMMSGAARNYLVNVTEKEKMPVAKGTFVVYKVGIAPEENDGMKFIYWITVSGNEVIKSATFFPEMMGGGTIIRELQ